MREAEELLAREDYIQASERAWGSSQIVKALAAKEGKELRVMSTCGNMWMS
ncbi:MAG: PaREP1 family protein [Candidatus Korarchaeum sp.]